MQVINQVLCLFIGRFMVFYFNDILICSTSHELHLQYLREVLSALTVSSLYTAVNQVYFLDKESIIFRMCDVKGWYYTY